MEHLLVETNQTIETKTSSVATNSIMNNSTSNKNNYSSSKSSSSSSSSDIITNTSSSSNSLTFTDDDDLSSSSGSTLPNSSNASTTLNNKSNLINNQQEQAQEQQMFSILKIAAPVLPLRSNQNSSSSSSSSSTTSSCSNNTNKNINHDNQIVKQQQQETKKFVFILNAFVNGFAQLKLCADKIDYEYIIEIYWSNEDRSFVKRTYDDFVIFHRNLLAQFSHFFNELNQSNSSNTNSNLLSTNSTSSSSRNSNRNSRIFFNNFEDYLMPVLPASKKPFWISHLKLAESREIELNSYVQRVLKLPTQISHSQLVLKFFESQTSDPKPATRYAMNLDISIDNKFYDDLDLNRNTSSSSSSSATNTNVSSTTNINANESDIESNYDDENEDDDDDDYDEDDEDNTSSTNYPSYLDNSTTASQSILNSGNLRKKKSNREAGLWWDEDEQLNELTSSMSFDFTTHLNVHTKSEEEYNEANEEIESNGCGCGVSGGDDGDGGVVACDDNDDECYYDKDPESITLRRLERILQTSDLFRNDKNENATPSSPPSSNLFNKNDNQLLSLS